MSALLRPTALALGLLVAGPVLAQQDVDAQLRQQRELERQRQLPKPTAAPPLAAPGDGRKAPDGPTLLVKQFVFEGNERFTSEQLQPVVASYLQRRLSLADLETVAAEVTRYYRGFGWLARVVVPPQQVDSGTVRLKVIEAVLGQTRFPDGTDTASLPVKTDVLVGNVQAQLKPGGKFNIPAAERGVLLANDQPGVGVSGSQVAGAKEAETDILLDVSAKGAAFGEATLDNYGSRSTGATRGTLRGGLNSPGRFGDQYDAILQFTQHMRYLRLNGSIPLGSDGLRLSANAAWLHYTVGTPEFAPLEPRGSSRQLGADLLYPILRSASKNLYVDLAVERKSPYNTSKAGLVSDYDISNVLLKLDANAFDSIGAGGISTANVTGLIGHVNQGLSTPADVGGTFQALRYRATRLQRFSEQWSLQAVFSGQAADRNLDSAERFYLGGPYGVRAYPVSEAGGSRGAMFNVDLRWRLAPQGGFGIELNAFYDWGRIGNHASLTSPSSVPNAYSLKGWGLGATVEAPYRVRLSAMVARRIGDNPGALASGPNIGHDQDGSLDKTRWWLLAALSF